MNKKSKKSRILFISSFPPRECGIATYTTDLINGITSMFSNSFECLRCELLNSNALNSETEFSINVNIREDYEFVAKNINHDPLLDLIHIQHEFGLYGGEFGENLLHFIKLIKKPMVFTFHTVLPKPSEKMKSIVQKIGNKASLITVMTKKSSLLLNEVFQIPSDKIKIINHGTHLNKWIDKEQLKTIFGVQDRFVLSTFGLLGEGKSIETAIYALPEIIKDFPNVLYLIIGKTHPNNIVEGKDSYREFLMKSVKELHLENHVNFIDQYLELQDLIKLLQATDIYLFTSKDPNQAVSGTFSYAMSCACPIVATSILHTQEILTPELGVLINIGDSKNLATATIDLLRDDVKRKAMSLNAFQKTRSSIWENVAIKHVLAYAEIINHTTSLKYDLPPLKLDHIKELTKDFGIIQFAKISIPDLDSGYTLDDNARALIFMCEYFEIYKDLEVLPYIEKYLSFIEYCQKNDGSFDNYIDKYGQVHIKNTNVNLEDSNARAVWALGFVISKNQILPNNLSKRAETVLIKCNNWINGIMSPRALSFIIRGLYSYNLTQKLESLAIQIESLAQKLITRYDINREKDWEWFEENLTYANSVLPEAMLYAYLTTGKVEYKNVAIESLDFLISKTFSDTYFKMISNKNWMHKDFQKSDHGEQPIDVTNTLQTLDIFYETFPLQKYKKLISPAFNWFLGKNHLQEIIYNPVTGGCNDGLEKENVNLNQGAESTISYLKARLIMEKIARKEILKNNNKSSFKKLHNSSKF